MKRRPEQLKQIQGQGFDLCVIGGCATGAGRALDAQLRGLRTVLPFQSKGEGACPPI